MKGKIVTRKCHCCDHHEVGMVTKKGNYIRLKEGMNINLDNAGKWLSIKDLKKEGREFDEYIELEEKFKRMYPNVFICVLYYECGICGKKNTDNIDNLQVSTTMSGEYCKDCIKTVDGYSR